MILSCNWKKSNNKQPRLQVKQSLYTPGQLKLSWGGWGSQISGLSARENVKVLAVRIGHINDPGSIPVLISVGT